MRHLLPIALLAASACSTVHLARNPRGFRERYKSVIGLPGTLYHPTPGLGLMTAFDAPKNENWRVVQGETGERATSIYNMSPSDTFGEDRERDVQRRTIGITGSTLFYLGRNAMTFAGLTTRLNYTRAAYHERTASFALDAPKFATVEWVDNSVAVGLPIGITLNFEDEHGKPTSTIVSGIGPTWTVYNHRRFLFDGKNGGVDDAARDATLTAYDERLTKTVDFQILALVGYPF